MLSTSTAEKSQDFLKYFTEYFEYEAYNKIMVLTSLQIIKNGIFILNESWNSHAPLHFQITASKMSSQL